MKECEVCNTKGFFLKLKNGLCEECYKELALLEEEYENILDKIVLKDIDLNEEIILLNKLVFKLRKFENTNSSVKASDCIRIIDGIQKDKEYKSNKTEENKVINKPIPKTTSDIELIKEHPVQITNDLRVETKVITNQVENTLNKHNRSKSIEPLLEHPYTKDENLYNSISSDIHSENTNEDVVLENIEKEPINKTNYIDATSPPLEEKPHIKKITSEDIAEISKILNLITDTNLSVQDLAYYTLTLKNNYLNELLDNNINEVNGIDVKEVIEDTLQNIAAKLKCKKDKVFDFFNYISIAIQTTGQNVPNSEIIEIYALKISYGKVIDTFHTFINPTKSISLSIENETGIFSKDIEDAPTIDIVLSQLSNFINNMKLVSYNSNFNMKFINHYSKLYNIRNPFLEESCVLKLYRTRYKAYHGVPTKKFDFYSICYDILPEEDIVELNCEKSKSYAMAHSVFKLYEILKYRYK